MTNFAYNFAGAGAVVADSIVSATTVTAGTGITATTGNIVASAGNVQGEILEWRKQSATEPGVRDAVDTDVGIGRSAANTLSLSGGGNYAFVTVNQLRTGSSSVEFSSLGRTETRAEERKTWRTTVTVAAATQIPVAGAMRVRVDPSGGAVTSTAAPLFSGSPADGDEVTLVNVNATNAYTLNHHGNAGVNSGLFVPGGTTLALPALTGSITFRYQASDTRWYPIAMTV